VAKKRLSPEQTQENISRKEFARLLERHGWVTTDVVPDLGEDLLVRVYDNGVFTGISCYVQLKSTQNIDRLRLKSGDLSYVFEVGDLQHWEDHGVPVLLVVWDIEIEQGCYLWIKDAISQLNSRNRLWRHQKSVKVHIPKSHNFDENTFVKLRQELAIHYHPTISKGRDQTINVEFKFPTSGGDAEKWVEFQRFIDEGDEVVLDGRFITKFQLPDWWINLHGEMEIGELRMGPAHYDETKQFQFRFISNESDPVILSNVELRMEKGGIKEVTWSNVHQKSYYTIKLVINKDTTYIRMSVILNFDNINGYDARNALKIMRLMAEGCKVAVRNLEIQDEFLIPVPENSGIGPPYNAVDFINKVCFIQDRMGILFSFQDGGSYTRDEEAIANKLVAIIKTGKYERSSTVTFGLGKAEVAHLVEVFNQSRTFRLEAVSDESSETFLGKDVLLGKVNVYAQGYLEAPIEEVKSWLEKATDLESFQFEIKNAQITEVYEDWGPS
jgi:hypothetical protein